MLVDLECQIERITYSNEDNGYTIARVKVLGQSTLVTIVGNIMNPVPGEIIKLKGKWVNHPKYGEQFQVVQYETKVPATLYGIRKYLGSGLIKGIGPVMAGRIVKQFGGNTLDIIEKDIESLTKVDGIGRKRIEMIKTAWTEQKEIRQVMVFLQTHRVSSGYATKIFKQYGNRSIEIVKENPYKLATDIFGIGFVTADNIAEKLGFAKDSKLRIQAGILYVLHQLSDDGHVCYPYDLLLNKCHEILIVDIELVIGSINIIEAEKKIIVEDVFLNADDTGKESVNSTKVVYLAKFHLCETYVSKMLKRMLNVYKHKHRVKIDKAIESVQQKLSIILAENQVKAVKSSVENKVLVITGGPGTGKTTIINAVIRVYSALNLRIMLAAPTGRAAKRMTETTGYEAKTIHRLLDFSFKNKGFQKNEDNLLNCDLIVVDEASMIDTILMYHFLKAIPVEATLIFVGDVSQLPSVGAGNVLNDIIRSAAVPVVRLNKIFRQAQKSQIIINAHKINKGIIPSFKVPDLKGAESDYYFIDQDDPEKVLNIILLLIKERIPRKFGFDPTEDIQILTPMNKGIVGVNNLNVKLQEILNPGKNSVVRGDKHYRIDDKVMQIRNNYDKDVFNGDIGKIVRINPEDHELIIVFNGLEVTYDFSEIDEITLAYAISIHKSQGSEYPAVIIPVLTQHYVLLQRNLVYTAITRGKKLVVLVGMKKALAIAVKKNKVYNRFTYMWHRLR